MSITEDKKCALSKRSAEEIPLIRFAMDPDGILVADVYEKLPVKGMWLSADKVLLAKAIEAGEIARIATDLFGAAPRVIEPAGTMLDQVDRLLEKQVMDRLGLMRGAGWLRLGFEKAVADIKSGRARMIIEAADAATGSADKLRSAIMSEGTRSKKNSLTIVNILTRECLSASLGQENLVYAAVRENGMLQTFASETLRLAAFRGKSLPVIG